jgi:organic hydroperoxide reductase OsmC/OhrA
MPKPFPPSKHLALVEWQRGDGKFTGGVYSRAHTWKFDGGVEVPASASPHVVRVPYSDPAGVDPEEAFAASVASCHMLTFLYLACKAGHVVESYRDHAEALLAFNSKGKQAITEVVLHPVIVFAEPVPTSEKIEELHHAAHEECFIANSVNCEVRWAK